MTQTPVFALPTFDVREIPFSVRGSWLNLSPVVALHARADAIHVVSHRNGMHAVLRCEPVTDAPVAWTADPATLTWRAGECHRVARCSTAPGRSGCAARASRCGSPTRPAA